MNLMKLLVKHQGNHLKLQFILMIMINIFYLNPIGLKNLKLFICLMTYVNL